MTFDKRIHSALFPFLNNINYSVSYLSLLPYMCLLNTCSIFQCILLQDKDKLGREMDKKKDKKKKKKAKKKDQKKSASGKDSSSDFSSDSESDSDTALKEKDNKKPNSAHSSRCSTPTPTASGVSDSLKRKQSGSPDLSQAKKLKLDNFNLVPVTSYIPGAKYTSVFALDDTNVH